MFLRVADCLDAVLLGGNLSVAAQLQALKVLGLPELALVVCELDVAVIRPNEIVHALALKLRVQRIAQTAVERLRHGIIIEQEERHVEHVEHRQDGRPHRRRVQTHVEPAGHDRIVHTFVGVKLTCGIKRDSHFAAGLFFDAFCEAIHALAEMMFGGQMVRQLELNLVARRGSIVRRV